MSGVFNNVRFVDAAVLGFGDESGSDECAEYVGIGAGSSSQISRAPSRSPAASSVPRPESTCGQSPAALTLRMVRLLMASPLIGRGGLVKVSPLVTRSQIPSVTVARPCPSRASSHASSAATGSQRDVGWRRIGTQTLWS